MNRYLAERIARWVVWTVLSLLGFLNVIADHGGPWGYRYVRLVILSVICACCAGRAVYLYLTVDRGNREP